MGELGVGVCWTFKRVKKAKKQNEQEEEKSDR